MSAWPARVTEHPVLGPAEPAESITFTFNGQPIEARAGEVVAAALLAHGVRTLRRTAPDLAPRGLYCAIGHCYECQMTIDGRPGIRACLTKVRPGMRVTSNVELSRTDAGQDGV